MTKPMKDLRKEIKEGEPIPKFYGISYLEPNRLGAICYPIPLNILIGYIRKIYLWFLSGWDFKTGYEKGFSEGLVSGRAYAFNMIKRQVIKNDLEVIIKRFMEYEAKILEKHRNGKAVDGWIWKFIEAETKRLAKRNQ